MNLAKLNFNRSTQKTCLARSQALPYLVLIVQCIYMVSLVTMNVYYRTTVIY